MDEPLPRWLRVGVPTSLTLINLACGVAGIAWVVASVDIAGTARTVLLAQVMGLMVLAMIADGLDGYAARRLKGVTAAGRWLDVLADAVTFSLLPALTVLLLVVYPWLTPGSTGQGTLAFGCVAFAFAGWARLIREAIRRPISRLSYRGLPLPYTATLLAGSVLLSASTAVSVADQAGYVLVNCWLFGLLMIGVRPHPKPALFFRWVGRHAWRQFAALLFVALIGTVMLGVTQGRAGAFMGAYLAVAGAYAWMPWLRRYEGLTPAQAGSDT